MTTLYIRLSLVFFGILLIFGVLSLWIADHSARAYFIESTQKLNAPIARYMAESTDLVTGDRIDTQALAELAERIMIINPSVELYLLDTQGNVIAQAANANRIAPIQVDLEPVVDFLSLNEAATTVDTVLGDNPLNPDEKRAFSAAPLMGEYQVIGYVYAVLAGDQHANLLRSIRTSYSVRNLALMLGGTIILASLGGGIIFFTLTKRLRNLTQKVQGWQNQILSEPLTVALSNNENEQPVRDEIDELTRAYDAMASELHTQYQTLDLKDRNRRELMANISHDLKTPLTTLQGYLETLLIKQGALKPQLVKRYLGIAHKQGKRLGILVDQLFELSKFESGDVVLNKERFSMLELAHDALQDFEMRARRNRITLQLMKDKTVDSYFDVVADISLIHRVLENLIDNALRYTPQQGTVRIHLTASDTCVQVGVSDTGSGISKSDIPRVFEPRFSASMEKCDSEQHAGLGLAIVDRIVTLHGSQISVRSVKEKGTLFVFRLKSAQGSLHH
jgi:signal transduction histidine kinase